MVAIVEIGPIAAPADAGKGRVIVLGNEKGGTGKSTTALHLIVGMLRKGYRVASIDLDLGQETLTRYLENRRHFAEDKRMALPFPDHRAFSTSTAGDRAAAEEDERTRLAALIEALKSDNHFVVVDCPGTDSRLARVALAYADAVITPVNDSFVDLDLLARIEGDPPRMTGPSRFSETVWEARKARAARDGGNIDWIVLRNRQSSLGSRNARLVEGLLGDISRRLGCRLAGGFGERVIFRELFLQGLTVLDIRDQGAGVAINISHLAARQELRGLMDAVGLPNAPAASEEGAAEAGTV